MTETTEVKQIDRKNINASNTKIMKNLTNSSEQWQLEG